MMQNLKPLSPHLTIYKIQITSALSILHRITGVFLFFGLLAILWITISFVYSYSNVLDPMYLFYTSNYGKALLILWSYCLFFHFCTGIRYMIWGLGKGFDIKYVNISGWLVIISSIILTTISWLAAFSLIVA